MVVCGSSPACGVDFMVDRCSRCDRVKALITSPLYPMDSCFAGALFPVGDDDCKAHTVDWISRCRRAEECLVAPNLDPNVRPGAFNEKCILAAIYILRGEDQ